MIVYLNFCLSYNSYIFSVHSLNAMQNSVIEETSIIDRLIENTQIENDEVDRKKTDKDGFD